MRNKSNLTKDAWKELELQDDDIREAVSILRNAKIRPVKCFMYNELSDKIEIIKIPYNWLK